MDCASDLLGMTPYVGDVKDAQEFVSGVDQVTGKQLTPVQRGLTGLAFLVPVVGGNLLRKLAPSVEVPSLPDSALVVRGGQSTAENLVANQAKDIRGHISCNVGTCGLEALATTPQPFPNGQISVTTVGDIRGVGPGWDVIPDPTKSNPLHGSIITPNGPLSRAEAEALSEVFSKQPNVWRDISPW